VALVPLESMATQEVDSALLVMAAQVLQVL
jgi:hypothetical protein